VGNQNNLTFGLQDENKNSKNLPNTTSSISISKLLRNVDKTIIGEKYFGKILDFSSKVLDENGEPKVVYVESSNGNNIVLTSDNNNTPGVFIDINKPLKTDDINVNIDKLKDGYDGIITTDNKYVVFNEKQIITPEQIENSLNNDSIFDIKSIELEEEGPLFSGK